MKLLHHRFVSDDVRAERFVAEARDTARLEHPAIVPIHDWGILENGRPWFTMRIIEGCTLGELATEQTFEPVRHRHRLVVLVEQTARAVAHAHGRGVVHRDLKPANVMIGPLDALCVMDWGIAAAVGRMERGVGTPPFMAPEQATADAVPASPATDVYALGALLFFVLAGRGPYLGEGIDGLRQIQAGPPEDVREVAERDVPEALAEVVEHALARAPSDRPRSAVAVAKQVRKWLDGEADRARARRLYVQVSELPSEASLCRKRAHKLEAEARSILARVARNAAVEHKRAAWTLEDDATALRARAEGLEMAYASSLSTALALDPALVDARDALGVHLVRRLDEIGTTDPLARARLGTALAEVDPDRHGTWRESRGTLTLAVEPEDAELVLERDVCRDRRTHWLPVEVCGRPVVLPSGTYRARWSAPGRVSVSQVVAVRRGEDSLRAPGSDQVSVVRLPSSGRPDEVVIPAGWTRVGGDPDAPDALDAHTIWVEAFAIGVHPITVGAYAEFLSDLPDAERHAPALVDGTPMWTTTGSRWRLGPRDGPVWSPRRPIVLVSWNSAVAYAAWRESADGLAWRLPHELEWARAARGPDGRRFPWGQHLDPSWAAMKFSHAGEPAPEPVDARRHDVSPFGVCGLGGNVRDLCLNDYLSGAEALPERLVIAAPAPEAPYRAVRGGSWHSAENFCRSAARFVVRPTERTHSAGFRLARSV